MLCLPMINIYTVDIRYATADIQNEQYVVVNDRRQLREVMN